MSLSRARSTFGVFATHVRQLWRTRSSDEMQPVSHGVFLFGEVSKDVLAVSQGVLSEERLRGCHGRDGTEVREVDAKSREASGFERW